MIFHFFYYFLFLYHFSWTMTSLFSSSSHFIFFLIELVDSLVNVLKQLFKVSMGMKPCEVKKLVKESLKNVAVGTGEKEVQNGKDFYKLYVKLFSNHQ